MSNIKNYHEQGGDKWVVKGDLEFADEGRLFFNGQQLKPAEGLVDLGSGDTVTATVYNQLLEKLYAAGIMIADKSALDAAVLAALGLLVDVEIGDWDGAYSQAAYNTFVAAIETAQGVLEAGGVSQSEVNTAKTTLDTAVSTFEAAVVEIDKSALGLAITAAETLLSGATVGTAQGEYPQEACDAFSDAIDAAQAVYDNDTVNQTDVGAAVTALGAAQTTFEAAEIA